MSDSASVSIVLNAGGNLGQVVDANTGKLLRMGKAGTGSAEAIRREASKAAGAVGVFGEKAGTAFGGAGAALAKFAGPLGALGGVAAASGLMISKALDLAREKFVALVEEPVKLAEAMRNAAREADALAKSRDAALAGKVGAVGETVDPLLALGGDAALAMARRISLDTGVPLDDVAGAVTKGAGAGLGDDAIRRLVEGAHLAARSGRMSFGAAVDAGVANRVDAGFSPAEVAADMVNREAFLAHQKTATDERMRQLEAHQRAQDQARAEHDERRRAAYDRAQADWNLGGQQGPMPQMGPEFTPAPFRSTVRFRPAVTAEDFAAMQERLAGSAVGRAVQGDREAAAEGADRDIADIEKRGEIVIEKARSAARAARSNPGLEAYLESDRKLVEEQEIAEKRADAWSFLGPWNPRNGAIRKIADERKRRFSALMATNPTAIVGEYQGETVEEFNARTSAERDRIEAARQQQGIPFGAGILNVRIVNPEAIQTTVPGPAQEGE